MIILYFQNQQKNNDNNFPHCGHQFSLNFPRANDLTGNLHLITHEIIRNYEKDIEILLQFSGIESHSALDEVNDNVTHLATYLISDKKKKRILATMAFYDWR